MVEFTAQVSANTDDGQESGDTTWLVNGQDSDGARVGNAGADYDMGMRFTNVTIPVGATITSAVVEVFMKWQAGGDDIITLFRGCDEDNAATFGTTDRPSQRASTTAVVNRTYTDAADWSDESWLSLDDCTDVVQEIIDRAGWASGNAMAFVFENNGSASTNRWQFHDYNYGSTNAAKITINYTTGGGSTILPQMIQHLN